MNREHILHFINSHHGIDEISDEVAALLKERDEAVRLLKHILKMMEDDDGYTPEVCQYLRDECGDDGGEPCRTLDAIRAFLEKAKDQDTTLLAVFSKK